MFHACGIYVPCLRPLSTTHGYDKERIAFWGARKRLGALAVLCGFERRACNTGAGFVLFGSCFTVVLLVVRSSGFVLSVVLFVVRSSVRAFGRSFRGSCFWSFFGFVLLVVLFVVRSSGSFFWGLVCVFCSML